MQTEHLYIVRQLALFSGFSNEEIHILTERGTAEVVGYRKGAIVHLQDRECRTFDIILEGALQIQRINENGNVLTVAEFLPGDTLGGNLVYADRNTYPMTVVSRGRSVILHIQKHRILEMCSSNRKFLLEFLRLVSNRSYELGTRFSTITLKTIRQKVIHFLSKEYRKTGSLHLKLDRSRNEWAREIGVERPSLSRELAKMKADGLIEYDRNLLTVLDSSILDEV